MMYGFCDMIKLILLKLGIKSNVKYKTRLFEKGMDYYLHNLDIFTYFTKMRELDLIKYLLFNGNEINLIDFLSKPSISYRYSQNDSPICNSSSKFTVTIDNIERVSDSFKKVFDEYKDKNAKDLKANKLLQQTSYEVYQLIHE